MSKRYSRIWQAGKLQPALENYLLYLQGKAESTLSTTTRTALPKQALYVSPFGYSLGANDKLQVGATQVAWNQYKGDIGSHATDTLATGVTALRIRNVKPARIVIVTPSTEPSTLKPSHITKTQYKYRKKTSMSVPFGRAASTDVEEDVFNLIKAEIAPAGSLLKVYLQPEEVH